jgi:hypothetical protein
MGVSFFRRAYRERIGSLILSEIAARGQPVKPAIHGNPRRAIRGVDPAGEQAAH